MNKRKFYELLDCVIFGIANGLGNCIGHWLGTYFIEKTNKINKRKIGF